jgi:ubiquinone/menaquinone biosynthesis C-methylase UbiE
MKSEEQVAGHYTRGGLAETILQALARSGKDPDHIVAEDLAGVDEFHVGGIEATQALAEQMELEPGMRLLDVGSGIGGPARYFAGQQGCKVTGIDLKEEFVNAAKRLTQMVKLDHLVDFRQGSALQMPFEKGTFDRACMIHVGMNIADKAGVYREVRRVLKPGGLFTVFDILRMGTGAIQYPVPWAMSEETSFVADLRQYTHALETSGFKIERERRRGTFGIEFTEKVVARLAEGGPLGLGLHLLMGEKTPLMIKNILAGMQQGVMEPVEIFARAA